MEKWWATIPVWISWQVEALNGTTVLDTICLLKGADILRVHDVKEAVETVRIVQAMRNNS